MSNKLFSSRMGVIAATLGSAVGLGNVWRFPAEAQANGGAAFLLLYIACVIVLGVPMMLVEMSLGRHGRSDVVGVFKKLEPGKPWWGVGALAILASLLITGFYMVVEGWTVEYLWNSITGALYEGTGESVAQTDAVLKARMGEYINSDFSPLIFTLVVFMINVGILIGGVQKGIERVSNILMPMFFVVLAILCCMTLSLDGAGEGLRWFLSPDFSLITWDTVVNALGQTFFSLSIGMGCIVTYASYYPDNTRLTGTAVIVAMMSLLVALMVGCVIFPSVTHFGLTDHGLAGSTLVFRTLPNVFSMMPGTAFWSILFFTLLFVAALTSTVSMVEVTVAFMQERLKLSRAKAVVLTVVPMIVLGIFSSLSFGSLSDFTIAGKTFFDLLDFIATNLILPLGGIILCIYVGWFAPKTMLREQLTNHGKTRLLLLNAIIFIIRYVAPLLIGVIMVFTFI